MTGTMNNARQLYLAAFQMAKDGAANSDPNYAWPGDDPALTDLAGLLKKLVQNDYLKAGDCRKSSARRARPARDHDVAAPPALSRSRESALKVYKVRDVDPANTIFAVDI